VIKLNPAAEVIFGPEAQHIGKPVAEIAHDSQIALAVAEALSSQRPVVGRRPQRYCLSLSMAQSARFVSAPPRCAMKKGGLLGAVTLLGDITRLREN